MTRHFYRIAGIAIFSCFVLQACMTSPPERRTRLDAHDKKAPQLAGTSMAASEHAVGTNSANTVAATNLQAFSPEILAKLQKAQALDADAARLLAEAIDLERQARLSKFLYSNVAPDKGVLFAEAASRRTRAAQVSEEASELRRQVNLEADSVRYGSTGTSLNAISSSGILGGVDSFIRNPFGAVFGLGNIGSQFGASVGHAIADSPNTSVPNAGIALKEPWVTQKLSGGKRLSTPNLTDTQNAPASSPTTNLPPIPVGDLATESGKIESLVHGSAAVSAPSTVKAGDSFSVFLRVSPEKLAVVMQTLKDEFPENPTVKGRQNIKLTPRMMASVSGFGFEISPKDGQVQAVSAKEATTWAWQVKALESGLHTLTFTLSGALTIEGKEVPRNFYQYQQKVEVEVSPVSFVEQYWQWLVTTLAIPAIGAAWAAFRKPKDDGTKHRPNFIEKLRERRRRRETG